MHRLGPFDLTFDSSEHGIGGKKLQKYELGGKTLM